MKRIQNLGIVLLLIMGVALFSGTASAEDDCCDVYSPGYWKNHDEWPLEEIRIGLFVDDNPVGNAMELTKEQARDIMKLQVNRDKRVTLFRALVAAKLNDELTEGTPQCCLSTLIPLVDQWFTVHGVPTFNGDPVKANSDFWQGMAFDPDGTWYIGFGGEHLYRILETYNNGEGCGEDTLLP